MMLIFLIPLLIGFAFNSASAFTTFYSARFGPHTGRLVCILMRDVLGIPMWAIGFALAVVVDSPILIATGMFTSVLAWLLVLCGSALIIAGMVSLRWKAAAPSMKDSLVTSGLYAHIRHPLYSGMFLQLCGLALWVPRLNLVLACLIGVLWIVLQARLEEIDLLQRLPSYRDYMQRVPSFIPKFKRNG